jgi:hypothetical protein
VRRSYAARFDCDKYGSYAAKNGSERRGVELKLRGCRKVQRWLLSGLQTDGGFSDAAICAGLDVAANLKIAATSGGRANRPYQKLSTGAPKKAKPTPAHHTRQHNTHTQHHGINTIPNIERISRRIVPSLHQHNTQFESQERQTKRNSLPQSSYIICILTR